jgi:hypothetical protein
MGKGCLNSSNLDEPEELSRTYSHSMAREAHRRAGAWQDFGVAPEGGQSQNEEINPGTKNAGDPTATSVVDPSANDPPEINAHDGDPTFAPVLPIDEN